MNIAFCLFGIVGGKYKYGMGDTIDYVMCGENYKNMIFGNNNVDVFFHTWSIEHEKGLVKTYNPKKYIAQPQIDFKPPYKPITISEDVRRDWFVECCHWYSVKRSIEIQNEFNKTYDFIMLSRFDMLWDIKINFNELEKNTLYYPNLNPSAHQKGATPDRTNTSYPFSKAKHYHDMWLIGNQEQMMYLTKIYDVIFNMNSKKYNPHRTLFAHMYPKYGSVTKFLYYYGIDYHLYRRKILGSW